MTKATIKAVRSRIRSLRVLLSTAQRHGEARRAELVADVWTFDGRAVKYQRPAKPVQFAQCRKALTPLRVWLDTNLERGFFLACFPACNKGLLSETKANDIPTGIEDR